MSQSSTQETTGSKYPKFSYTWIVSLFERKLNIPHYQRPYRWQPKHVIQLLEDIQRNNHENRKYRIGTVILHKNGEQLDIVDGQQRLVTISLILHYLSVAMPVKTELPLLKEAFPHSDSQQNIIENYKAIKDWFSGIGDHDQGAFADFILQKCQLVEIILEDLSEAFQLFDSQNARGKALEPYDLLKAFHLREMSHETEEERKNCVRSWEEAVNTGMLNNLGKYIFRIRKWARGGKPGEFSKEDIGEFKGINIQEARKYPFMRPYVLNNMYSLIGLQDQFSFQLTQPIINGRLFFKLVEHYNAKYRLLFKTENPVREFYLQNCKYAGSHRIGDRYVSELFKALLIFYHDKFEDTDLQHATITFYKWAYRLRLKQSRVFYSSIDKYVEEGGNFFRKLERSYQPKRISTMGVSLKDDEIKYHIQEVKTLFNAQ